MPSAQASRLAPNSSLAHLGNAQMLLRENETINAAAELESALAAAQNDIDSLRMLGQLFAVMPERVKKNLALFKEAAKKQPGDAELQEMLGELSSTDNPLGKCLEAAWVAE